MTPARDTSAKAVRTALLLLLAARLVLGLAYSALNPLGEAPDEAVHYAYISFIGREARLPVGSEMTQGKHPPLYYLTAALLARWTGLDFTFLRSNPDVGVTAEAAAPNFFVHTSLEDWPWRGGALAMHLARLLSVLCGVILTAATYALGRAIWPNWYSMHLAAAAFVAFLSETLFVGGSVNNDVPAATFATLALWAALRSRRPRDAILAGLFMGLGLLTKASTGALWPVIGLAIFAREWRSHSGWRRALTRVALAGVPAVAVASSWLWRNWRLYGDFLGWPVVLATVDQRQGPLGWGDLLQLARGWFYSFWGKFGGAGHLALPAPLYAIWIILAVAAIIGWLRWWHLARRNGRYIPLYVSLADRLVLLGSPALVILWTVSYSRVALGTDQGRLLFPALAPMALLLVAGLAAWFPAGRQGWLVGGFTGLMALVAAAALYAGIVRPFTPPAPPDSQEIAQASSVGRTFGNDLELVALRWGDRTGTPQTPSTRLTLYWRLGQPTRNDLRTVLRLIDRDGNLVWEWKRSPGAGRFSTDRWPPGRLVADAYHIPAAALDKMARAEVGVYSFPVGIWLSVQEAAAPAQYLTLYSIEE
ncbi:MAG: glycosyltransferase family 39 protein [Anaerolineae bacterium]|nr:glycosyltransferase family 39 protein [Anaerolineae bacterium]